MHTLQLVAVALLVALPANGFAVPILGRKLLIQGSAFSIKPTRKSISCAAKKTATDVGTLSDPTVSGASLQIVTSGGSPTSQTYTLDVAGWTAMTNGYRYRTPGNPSELQVRIGKTPGGVASLKVTIKKDTIGLLPPAPGDEALLILDVTGGDRYCVSFGGAAGGTETKDTATLWKINNATAQPACPTGTPLPPCSGEFTPCGTCGDGICVAHTTGSPPFVCASTSGSSAGTCSTNVECTAPRECSIPASFPVPGSWASGWSVQFEPRWSASAAAAGSLCECALHRAAVPLPLLLISRAVSRDRASPGGPHGWGRGARRRSTRAAAPGPSAKARPRGRAPA